MLRPFLALVALAPLLLGSPIPAVAAAPPTSLSGTLRMGEPGQKPYAVIKPAEWNVTLFLDLDFNGWNALQKEWFLGLAASTADLGAAAFTRSYPAPPLRT